MLTLEHIARLRALYEASTPQPWYVSGTVVRVRPTLSVDHSVGVLQAVREPRERAEADVVFVAAAARAFWELLELAEVTIRAREGAG